MKRKTTQVRLEKTRAAIHAALVEVAGSTVSKATIEQRYKVQFGSPSVKKILFLNRHENDSYLIKVPKDWLATVHANKLAVCGGKLCLRAIKIKGPPGVDGAWSVSTLDFLSGTTVVFKCRYAVSFGGQIAAGNSTKDAMAEIQATYLKALTGGANEIDWHTDFDGI